MFCVYVFQRCLSPLPAPTHFNFKKIFEQNFISVGQVLGDSHWPWRFEILARKLIFKLSLLLDKESVSFGQHLSCRDFCTLWRLIESQKVVYESKSACLSVQMWTFSKTAPAIFYILGICNTYNVAQAHAMYRRGVTAIYFFIPTIYIHCWKIWCGTRTLMSSLNVI